jgi:hypothetical protein
MRKTADQRTIIELFPGLRQYPGEIGIEIEMEGERLHLHPLSYWTENHDNSLRGNSVEWVLNQPVVREDVAKRLQYLDKRLKKNEAECVPSDRCGVHVHLNCQQLTVTQVFNIVTLYLMFEEPLLRYCGDERQGNLFCLRASDAEQLIAYLVDCRITSNFGGPRNQYRYAALNIEALRKFGSLEFRSLPTPQNVTDIQTWIDVICRIKDVAIRYNHPREIVEEMSANGARQFFNHVVGDYMEVFDYPDIEREIIYGMRQAQEIAYTRIEPKKVEVAAKVVRERPLNREAWGNVNAMEVDPPLHDDNLMEED